MLYTEVFDSKFYVFNRRKNRINKYCTEWCISCFVFICWKISTTRCYGKGADLERATACPAFWGESRWTGQDGTGRDRTAARANVGAVIDDQRVATSRTAFSTPAVRTSRRSDYDRMDEQQASGFTHAALVSLEDPGELLLRETQSCCCALLCCSSLGPPI